MADSSIDLEGVNLWYVKEKNTDWFGIYKRGQVQLKGPASREYNLSCAPCMSVKCDPDIV